MQPAIKRNTEGKTVFFILAFVLWTVLHSVMASAGFKARVRAAIGQRPYDGLYRLAYNFLAVITFVPVLWLARLAIPDVVLWRVPRPFSLLFLLVQGVGLVGLVVGILQTDLLRFAGLGQAIRFLQGEENVNPPPTLVTRGTYAYVRHPLYFFSLLMIWFLPIMTLSTLLFNVLVTLYFWIGSVYEERRLASTFGDAYREYQRNVPRLLPIKLFA